MDHQQSHISRSEASVNPDAWLLVPFMESDLRGKVRNLLSRLVANEEVHIVIVGLKASGKTTIMENINPSEMIIRRYDDGVEIVRYYNIEFAIWDVGVQAENQPVWRYDTPGLIFVVDSNDRDRVVEAKNELHRILNEYEFRDAVLLVFANKKDLSNPMDAAEITDNLSLHSLGQRHMYTQHACAISEEGLYEGLEWFVKNIANKSSNTRLAEQTRE